MLAGAAATTACSLLVGTDDLSESGASVDAASVVDGAGLPDTSSPAVDAQADTGATEAGQGTTNLLDNGTFESGCTGRWVSNDPFATITESSDAHGGSRSCQICSSAFDAGGAPVYFFSIYSQVAPRSPVPGEEYQATTWIKQASAGGSFDIVTLNLAELAADGGIVDEVTSSQTTPGAGWTSVSATKAFASGVQLKVSVRLRRFNDQSACVLLDDAELVAK